MAYLDDGRETKTKKTEIVRKKQMSGLMKY